MFVYILRVYIKIKKCKDTGKGRKQKRGKKNQMFSKDNCLNDFCGIPLFSQTR